MEQSPATCGFSVEIFAPHGLRGIEPYLVGCLLPLHAWRSNYNGQVILRLNSDADEKFEWNMDPSNEQTMFASGYITDTPQRAEQLLESLSACLATARFPHQILLDDHEEGLYRTIEFEWPPRGGEANAGGEGEV